MKYLSKHAIKTASAMIALGALIFGITAFVATIASAQASTAKIVVAANAFVVTLNDAQKKRVQFDYDDARQRVR